MVCSTSHMMSTVIHKLPVGSWNSVIRSACRSPSMTWQSPFLVIPTSWSRHQRLSTQASSSAAPLPSLYKWVDHSGAKNTVPYSKRQLFFNYRAWRVTKQALISFLLSILSLLRFIASIALAAEAFLMTHLKLFAAEFRWLITVVSYPSVYIVYLIFAVGLGYR